MPKPATVNAPAELLEFLFNAWPEVKRKQVRTWLKFEAVTVNGQPVSQFNHPLKTGDIVAIQSDRHATPDTVPGTGIKIRFEDATLIVIEKPVNLLSIATDKGRERTAYSLLMNHVQQGRERSRERVWIVHRLDRETSGLMVFARNPQAKESLQKNWQRTEKLYQAIVEGSPPAMAGTLESDLDESNPGRVFSTSPGDGTRHAITHYRVLKRHSGRTLVEVTLETGRRNQIRVQLADVGCPVVGDEKYGAKTNPARRLCLHACALRFTHPATRQETSFESPLPQELARLVN